MASMRDIKRRRDSIESTEQITRAMKLVSTAKLQKARERAEASAAYTKLMYEIICSILGRREIGTAGMEKQRLQDGKQWRRLRPTEAWPAGITIT